MDWVCRQRLAGTAPCHPDFRIYGYWIVACLTPRGFVARLPSTAVRSPHDDRGALGTAPKGRTAEASEEEQIVSLRARFISCLFVALTLAAGPRYGMAITQRRDECAATVLFEIGSSALSNEGLSALNRFVMECQKYFRKTVVVTGFADDRVEAQ